jgi:hypothetical protein
MPTKEGRDQSKHQQNKSMNPIAANRIKQQCIRACVGFLVDEYQNSMIDGKIPQLPSLVI